MSDIVNKAITLQLNRAWKPIGYKSVKDAIISLTGSESKPEPTSFALDIKYELNDDGTPNFENVINMTPLTWSEWIDLPVREWDLVINGPNKKYRVPTVVVASNFDKMPKKFFNDNPSKDNIFKRDNGICQYTGKKLSKNDANIDHVVPKDRGGNDTWENLVVCSKSINSKKGNKLNSEMGLKLIRQPIKPKPIDIMYLINEARHSDHGHFIIKS